MAGSYRHVTDERGLLREGESFAGMIENLGDAYEAVEEMYGMIWLLADGDLARVEDARARYADGLGIAARTLGGGDG